MFEKFIVMLLTEGGITILAIGLLIPAMASAQLFVRPVPVDRQGASPLMDGSPVDTAGDPAPRGTDSRASTAANPQGLGTGAIDDEQGQLLIDQYRREAGKVGPRKIFSDFQLKPRVSVGVAYDDNILATGDGRQRGDVITTLVGGFSLLLGDFATRAGSFLVLDYAATGELFAKNSGENALNHDASLLARYRPHDALLQFTSTYTLSHDATADAGQRVERQVFGDGLLFRYFRNDCTTLEAEVDLSRNDYDLDASSTQVWGGLAVDYLVVDRVTLGGGVVFGHLEADGGLGEYFEQVQGRFGYSVSNNIALSLRAGVEVRQSGGRAGTQFDPVFSLSGTWTPTVGTELTMEGHRRTEASAALAGDDYISTGIRFGVRQRLLQRFYGALDATYENADYQNVTLDSLTPRNDNYFNLRASMGYDFVEWIKLEAVYLFRTDASSQSNYTFTSNRFGLEASLIY